MRPPHFAHSCASSHALKRAAWPAVTDGALEGLALQELIRLGDPGSDLRGQMPISGAAWEASRKRGDERCAEDAAGHDRGEGGLNKRARTAPSLGPAGG